MATIQSFWLGIKDFLTIPIRLWRVHNRLMLLSSHDSRSSKTRQHQRERQLRLQLRDPTLDQSVFRNDATHPDSKSGGADQGSVTQVPQTDPSAPSATTSKYDFLWSFLVDRKGTDSLVTESRGLLKPLIHIWIINVGIILFLVGLYQLISLVPMNQRVASWFQESRVFPFIRYALGVSLNSCSLLFMELVNVLYLKKICDRVALLSAQRDLSHQKRGSSANLFGSGLSSGPGSGYGTGGTPMSVIGGAIADRFYSFIFFTNFQLQCNLLAAAFTSHWFSGLISAFAVDFLYACYAFEYRWRQVTNTSFEGFLVQIVDFWAYFMGYGLPLGLTTLLFPHFIGWGGILTVMAYPILVIGALVGSHWHPLASGGLDPKYKSPRLLRLILIIMMRPSLILSNMFVRFGAWTVYHLWFRQQEQVYVRK